MTSDEQKRKLAIVGASVFWRDAIPSETVQMYADELSDLTPEQVIGAINEIKKDTEVKRLPLPAMIRSFALGVNDVLDEARLVSTHIMALISKSGPYRVPDFSPVEKEVVERMGGWITLCSAVDYNNMGTVQAQMRDTAQSVIKNGIRKKGFEITYGKQLGELIQKVLPSINDG